MTGEFDHSRSFGIESFPALVFVVAIGVAMLTAMPLRAASADIATCDRLAAFPDDKDKPADVKGSYDIAKADVAAALKACKLAAAVPDVLRRIHFELGRAFEFNGQNAEAVKAYRKAADAGSTSAMVGLGTLLINGNGLKTNPTEARIWFEKAANAGDVIGMTNLASIYGGGVGVPVDFAMARSWFAKAAAANSSEGMYQLGLMTQDGDGGPKDDASAKALFEKAASLDHGGALERLGAYAEAGRAGPKDEKAAIDFFKRAAALGSDDAVSALKRLQCPFTIKDKQGKTAGSICFDGKN
jgi:TPR repeat protein